MCIPLPNNFVKHDGFIELPQNPKIELCDGISLPMELGLHFRFSGLKPEIAASDADIAIRRDDSVPDEGYRLICDDGINIFVSGDAGAYYAMQTLVQLMDFSKTPGVPKCEISDYPRFAWRGMHMDIARHFFGKDELLRIIDILSLYKFNRLHLHVSDDQGFRIEMARHPELNTVGSLRGANTVRRGRGTKIENTPHGGYLTKEEVREIVAYAAQRKINIVPEIDFPGHTQAIIASIPELSCGGEKTEVRVRYGISNTILCAGNEKSYEILCDIFDELCELFPFEYYHIGGDEAPKGAWKKCAKCQAEMKRLGLKNENALQSHLMNRIKRYLTTKGKTVIAWNDGINDNLDSDIVCQHWSPTSGSPGCYAIRDINSGRKAIMSNFFSFYFDYPYSMVKIEKTYGFEPVLKGITAPENVMGVESALWTEWIETPEKLWFNLLPRLCAVAETAWTFPEHKNYEKFLYRIKKQEPVWEKFGYNYCNLSKVSHGWFKSILEKYKFFLSDANFETDRQNG